MGRCPQGPCWVMEMSCFIPVCGSGRSVSLYPRMQWPSATPLPSMEWVTPGVQDTHKENRAAAGISKAQEGIRANGVSWVVEAFLGSFGHASLLHRAWQYPLPPVLLKAITRWLHASWVFQGLLIARNPQNVFWVLQPLLELRYWMCCCSC